MIAHAMGTRFSLITVDDQNGKIQKMLLKQYGLDGKLASFRSIGIDANDLYPEKTSEQTVLERASDAAKRCVAEDGAEVIIPGCTLIGSVLTYRLDDPAEALRAPVLDGMVTGFKMAEMMVDMQKLAKIPPVSRTGFFRFPPDEDLHRLRSFLDKA